jgi:hypothetical protein
MTEREQVLAEVLGSVRLEDAEPGSEVRAALEGWAAGELSTDDLNEIAERAATGRRQMLTPRRVA